MGEAVQTATTAGKLSIACLERHDEDWAGAVVGAAVAKLTVGVPAKRVQRAGVGHLRISKVTP